MSNKNRVKGNKHYVFIFYKNGTSKLHILSTADNILADKKRRKILSYLPYDKTIKKFFVITGTDNSCIFRIPLNIELNEKLNIDINEYMSHRKSGKK